jgi:ribonuclease P protein component
LRRAVRRGAIALLPNNAASPAAASGSVARGWLFPREARLVRRGDFDAVYRAGKRRSSSYFTVFFRPNELPQSRFGFSIKKALGNAVARNRLRRRMRETVRGLGREIPAGWDIVIHPKVIVEQAKFAVLSRELLRLLLSVTAAVKPLS